MAKPKKINPPEPDVAVSEVEPSSTTEWNADDEIRAIATAVGKDPEEIARLIDDVITIDGAVGIIENTRDVLVRLLASVYIPEAGDGGPDH